MKTNKMIVLTDTFNNRVISRHHTAENAVKAQHRHLLAVRRHNGPNSYLTYSIKRDGGQDISDDISEARCSLGY